MRLQLELGRATQPRLAGAPANTDAMKGHGKGEGRGSKYYLNRAQRLDQAARRQRDWAREQRRAEETGTEVETPWIVARKAERRRRQRERQAARQAAAAARRGERQQEEEEEVPWQGGEPQEQQQSSDERSRSARGRSPALSLRSAAHVHRTTDARAAFRPAREPLVLHNMQPRGFRPSPPSPSEVTPAEEHAPSEVTPASEHDPSEVTPAESSSDLEVQVITSDNRRARWSEEPSDDRRDASDDRCDDKEEEEEERQRAPDDRRKDRDYLEYFEIYFYSVDAASWSYCTSHDSRHFGEPHYYDVRDFRDPNADQATRRHDGRNRRIQDGLVGAHRYKFMLLVRAVCRDVRAAIQARRRGIAVAFWCNHGKHRSVAAAELMAGVFTLTFAKVTIEHISLDYYDNKCKCNECTRLLPQQDISEAAWRTFDEKWRVVDLNR